MLDLFGINRSLPLGNQVLHFDLITDFDIDGFEGAASFSRHG